MSEWFFGNNIIGNFCPSAKINDLSRYRVNKINNSLYLTNYNEKILLEPIDADSSYVISAFSNEIGDNNESIYQLQENNGVIAIILYMYSDVKKINGNQKIFIHLSNLDESLALNGNLPLLNSDLNNVKIKDRKELIKILNDNFIINNSILVAPEKNAKDFQIYGNKIRARVRMERTGVYLIDDFKKNRNNSINPFLVQLYGNVNFVTWDESTTIESNDELFLNEVIPNEVFKAWDEYEEYQKYCYFEKLKKFGLIKYDGYEMDHEKNIITFKLLEDLPINYCGVDKEDKEEIDILIDKNDVSKEEYEKLFTKDYHSENLGKYIKYDRDLKLLSFKLNPNLYDTLILNKGILLLSKRSVEVEFRRRKTVTKALRTKTNASLNLLMKLSDANVKNSDLGSTYEPINNEVLVKMFGDTVVKLNENYKEAMNIALNTPDIALIQGPPGTGKTTLIKGLIARLNMINKNYHILVSSEQHEALYNVVERLSQNNNIPPFVSSELHGNLDENVSIDVQSKFDYNVETFQNEFIKLCDNLLNRENREINKSDVLVELSFLLQSIKENNYDKNFILDSLKGINDRLILLGIKEELRDDMVLLENSINIPDTDIGIDKVIMKKIDRQIVDFDEYMSSVRGAIEVEGLMNLLKDFGYSNLLLEDYLLNKLLNNECTREEFSLYQKYVNDIKNKITIKPSANLENIKEIVNTICEKIIIHTNKMPKNFYEIVEDLKYKVQDIENAKNIIKKYTSVIGSTCAQAKSSVNYVNLNSKKYDYVIIDEASRANPIDLMIPIMLSSKVILIGDQNQLPHYVENETADNFIKEKNKLDKYDDRILKKSLFQILYENLDTAYNQGRIKFKRTIMLSEQHRMHPSISKYISDSFYDGKLKDGMNTKQKINDYNICDNKNIAWINIPADFGVEQYSDNSYYREIEANKIISILGKLIQNNPEKILDVGIISYYKKQVSVIREKLNESLPKNAFKNSFENMCNTVDSYQGKEFDIVIVSGVRSNNKTFAMESLGFISNSNSRVNVSLSRARKLLIFVGDEETFAKNEKFQEFVNYVKKEGYYEKYC